MNQFLWGAAAMSSCRADGKNTTKTNSKTGATNTAQETYVFIHHAVSEMSVKSKRRNGKKIIIHALYYVAGPTTL